MEEVNIHWTQLFGNKFRFALHPLMLSKEGYQVKLNTKIVGQSKALSFPVIVTFDETYVVEYVSRTLELLNPKKYNEWQKIVSKAYDHWESKKKNYQIQQQALLEKPNYRAMLPKGDSIIIATKKEPTALG